MNTPRLISIVVPVYNEESNVRIFVDAIRNIFRASMYSYEIIFVDDGSMDHTFATVRKLAESDVRVKGISLSKNFGSHIAITGGLSRAKGDAIVIMAVDLQDLPDLIHEFLKQWEAGYEVVWGVRNKRNDPLLKSVFSAIFYRLLHWIVFPDYPVEGTGSFCLIDRKVKETISTIEEKNRVIFGLIMWAGFHQTKVYYDRPSRKSSGSKWNVPRLFKTGIDVFTAYSYAPVRITTYFGILFILASFVAIICVVLNWYLKRSVVAGWSTIMISIFALGGVQMLSLGIIGEYIWRISEDVKRRPLFVVRDQIGV